MKHIYYASVFQKKKLIKHVIVKLTALRTTYIPRSVQNQSIKKINTISYVFLFFIYNIKHDLHVYISVINNWVHNLTLIFDTRAFDKSINQIRITHYTKKIAYLLYHCVYNDHNYYHNGCLEYNKVTFCADAKDLLQTCTVKMEYFITPYHILCL